jgi:hypothetical protein
MTRWTPYKCPYCGQTSTVPGWQLGLVGGIGGGLGGGLTWPLIRTFGWWSLLLVMVIVCALAAFGMMQFCHFIQTRNEKTSA